MRPAQPVTTGAPLPLHMANGNPLRVDVPAGTLLTTELVEPPADSALWALRAEQDRHFGK
jgi:predicted homoserine dehydrogenase-like protein